MWCFSKRITCCCKSTYLTLYITTLHHMFFEVLSHVSKQIISMCTNIMRLGVGTSQLGHRVSWFGVLELVALSFHKLLVEFYQTLFHAESIRHPSSGKGSQEGFHLEQWNLNLEGSSSGIEVPPNTRPPKEFRRVHFRQAIVVN